MVNIIDLFDWSTYAIEYKDALKPINCIGTIHVIEVTAGVTSWILSFDYIQYNGLLKFTVEKDGITRRVFFLRPGKYAWWVSDLSVYIIDFKDIDTILYTRIDV